MKNLKQRFLVLVTMMVVSVASYAYDAYIDGIYYNLDGKVKTAEVTNKTGSYDAQSYSGSVTIPSSITYDGVEYSVTSIGNRAFQYCSGLTSVTIPNSVTSIGVCAFWGCSGLTSVTIGNSVTSIGPDAFYATPWYNNQPDGLVYVGLVAYQYKGTMPEGTNITIKEGTKGIAISAFYGCSGLTSVSIPNSVTSIGDEAFRGCSGLTSVTIPNSVTNIGSGAFLFCSGLTSVAIGNSVTSIGDMAFLGCSGLTSVTIPNSVTSIEDEAFYSCSGLTSVTIGNSVTSIGERAFYCCSGLVSVTIPNSVTCIGDMAFYGCFGLTSVTIGNSVTSIEDEAFYGCSGLTSVTIGNSVISIGERAFYGCSGLTSVTIPNSVTSIGGGVFWGCSGLASVTIGNSVTSIGGSAFSGCSGLTSVTIPNSVTSIGDGAFEYCSGLTSVTIGSLESWCNISFSGFCSNPLSYAHHLCLDGEELKDIVIPNSVNSIGYRAFSGCKGLTSVTIPNSVTSIGDGAFEYCSNLRDIYSKNTTPPTCGSEVFSGVKAVNCRLHVPAGAKEDYAFADVWCDFYNILEDAGEGTGSDDDGSELEKLRTRITELEQALAKYALGDLNQDGHTDINDVALLLSMSTYESDPSALANLTDGTSITPAEIAERYGNVEYYTLDGTKVSEPSKSGIYLVKKGGETKMIVVKK